MMILASEAEILAVEGPIVTADDVDAEVDPAVAALSPEEQAAVAAGQVKHIHFCVWQIRYHLRVKSMQ